MDEIRGIITKFRYKQADSDFKIAEFEPESPKDGLMIILKGFINSSNLNMSVTIRGKWIDDPTYGRQFDVSSCLRNQPMDAKSVCNWMIKEVQGIGPKTAKAMADKFGDDLRDVVANKWQKLATIKGVSKKAADLIHKMWMDNALKREIIIFLIKYSLPATDNVVKKIAMKFGQDSVAKISDNPYRLIEISGFGFKTADGAAMRMGWQPDRPERVEAAMAYLLEEAATNGHSFLHRAELIDAVRQEAAVEVQGKMELLPEQNAADAIDRVAERGDIKQIVVKIDGQENKLCYLKKYYDLEVLVTKRVQALQDQPQIPPNNIGKILRGVEKKLGLEMSLKQLDAVLQALTHNCSVITGLPGTGKTSTCKALIQTAKAMGLKVMVCAPTGRAAKRLQEVTGVEAKTIHRTLGYIPKLEKFTYDEKLPLPCDMLIVDESSMLDLELMASVLKAVPDTCSVVWIGDVNQLPSIGAGMVLRDLINSKRVHTTVLDKIFRQAEGSLIIQNAHRIFRGETPKFPIKGTEADSYWIPVPRGISETSGNETDSIEFVKETLPKIYQKLKEKYGYDPIKDIQVLTPMRVGAAGYLIFNELIQNIVNPNSERLEVGGKAFRLNDRVMQIVNDYKLDVYNGDVGFIEDIDTVQKVLRIQFMDQMIDYPFEDVSNLVLSYASSVHKAQGSEFKCVILILLSHHYVMLDRNIIYTANTRARNMAVYLASRGAIETAVSTQKVLKRNSLLAKRLNLAIPKMPDIEKVINE